MLRRKPLAQWTIRELVVVLTVGIFVVGSMWAVEVVWQLAMLIPFLFMIGALIVAVVGRDSMRTFAAGYVLAAGVYFAALVFLEVPANQPIPWSNFNSSTYYALPTSRLWEDLYAVVGRGGYVIGGKRYNDLSSFVVNPNGTVQDKKGNVIGTLNSMTPLAIYSAPVPATAGVPSTAPPMVSAPPSTLNSVYPTPTMLQAIVYTTTPTADVFRETGNAFFLLLLGYLGGKFAIGIRRYQENAEVVESIGKESNLDG